MRVKARRSRYYPDYKYEITGRLNVLHVIDSNKFSTRATVYTKYSKTESKLNVTISLTSLDTKSNFFQPRVLTWATTLFNEQTVECCAY